MRVLLAALAAVFLSSVAAAEEYPPLAPFDRFVGQTWRGEGVGERGEPVIDLARWETILGGRAVQVTHGVNGGGYGGRTLIFYDEGRRAYVFHYFTTGGFHTQGEITLTETGFLAHERVSGHASVSEVRSEARFEGGGYVMQAQHLRDGAWANGTALTYRPIAAEAVVIGGQAH